MRHTYLDTICQENKMKRAIVPYQVTIQGLFTQHHFHLKRDFFFHLFTRQWEFGSLKMQTFENKCKF